MVTGKIYFETTQFTLKLCETAEELKKTQLLRFHELMPRLNEFLSFEEGLDEYDTIFDNLIVIEKQSGDVVGSYRLGLKSQVEKLKTEFCNEQKYNLDAFRALDCEVLELGKATVKREFRDGAVLRLLWKGVLDYCKIFDVRYMFGIIHFKSSKIEDCKNVLSYIFHNKRSQDVAVFAKQQSAEMNLLKNEEVDMKLVRAEMNPILKGYLAMGCEFSQNAHFDEVYLNRLSVLSILDIKKLSSRYIDLITKV